MCFQKYHVRFCNYCRSDWGEAQAGELVRCSNYRAGYPCRTMQDPVRHTSMCRRCQAHQREVEALSRTVDETRDRDEIAVSPMTRRQQDERRRRAEVDCRRGSRPTSPPRHAPSPRPREPSPRRTRGHMSRAEEDEEALAEEEAQYRYNRRREEIRRREERRRREEYRRGYPTSDERRRRGYY